MTKAPPGPVLRFADFEVNVQAGELRRYGHRIKLQDKPFQILIALLERSGAVVSREDLRQRLWPGNTFVDFDHNLNNAIDKLRKALNDSAEQPKFIETVPRKGYRFIAALERPAGPVQLTEATRPDTELPEGPDSFVRPGGAVPLDFPPTDSSARVSPPVSSTRGRGIRLAAGAFLVLSLLFVAFRFLGLPRQFAGSAASKAPEITSVVIEQNGALDPIDQGFRLRSMGHYESDAMRNAENSGFDRLRVLSDDLMYYYRSLTTEERALAETHDWKLSCVCAVETGAAYADIDFGAGGRRFDIELLQEGDKYFVGLTRQISPKFEVDGKTEFPGVSDVAHPHTFELRYSHTAQAASLWIDGRMVYSGYPGHTQWVQDRGLMFGTIRYLSSRTGIAVFRSVRFEVN